MKIKFYYILLFCFLCVGNISAAIKTFTGPGNFSTPGNWNLSTLPVAGDDIIIIGSCTFDNLANNFAYGTLTLGSGSAGTLNWPVGGTNTLNVTAVSAAVAASAINMTNGGTLQIRTSWSLTNTTFTAGTGTINWNNTSGGSTIPSTTYRNLTIDVTGQTATLAGAISVNGNLTLTAGTLATSTFGITGNATGTFTMAAGTNLNLGLASSATAVNFPSNFTAVNTTLNASSTVSYLSNANQTVSATPAYGNLTISTGNTNRTKITSAATLVVNGTLTLTTGGTGAVTFTLAGAATLNGSVNITRGTLNSATFQITGNASGTFTMAAGTALTIGATTSATAVLFPLNFTTGNITLNTTSTVTYATNGAQTISTTPTYGNLTITSGAAAGVKTLASTTINIAGNLSLAVATATLSATNATINLTGNLTGAGGLTFTSGDLNITGSNTSTGTFTCGTGTVTYNRTSTTQTVRPTTYNNLIFSNAATRTLATATTTNIGGTFTLNAGTFTLSGTATINMTAASATWTNNGATVTVNTSTINFTGVGTHTINGSAASHSFYTLTFSGTLTAPSILNIAGNFTNNGTFSAGSGLLNFNGTGAQTLGGTTATQAFNNFTVAKSAGSILSGGGSLSVIDINGTLTLTTGTFAPGARTINMSGATASWSHATAATFTSTSSTVVFNGTGAQTISGTAATKTFNNFTINKSAGTLSVSATTTLALNGTLTLTAGTFAPGATTINLAGATTSWTMPSSGFTYTVGTSTLNFNGTGAQTIDGTATSQSFYRITVNKSAGTLTMGGSLTTVNVGNNLTLTAGTFNISTSTLVNVTGNVILTAGTFAPGSATINLNGATSGWSQATAVTFTIGTSTVSFTGSGAQAINGTAATKAFNNFTINKSAGTLSVTATTNLTINGALALTAGTFAPGSSIINLAGATTSWTMPSSGFTFTVGTSTVNFNGTGAQSINGTATTVSFYNLNVNKSTGTLTIGGSIQTLTTTNSSVLTLGTIDVSSVVTAINIGNGLVINGATLNLLSSTTINMTGTITLTSGTFSPGTGTVNLSGATASWSQATAAIFNIGTSTVSFTGTGTQTISGTAATKSFYNLTINKSFGGLNVSTTTNLTINNNLNLTAGTFAPGATIINLAGPTTSWSMPSSGFTFTIGTSTVNFNGSGAQVLGGTAATLSFYNLSVANTGTITPSGSLTTLNISNNFTLTSGAIALNTITTNLTGNLSGAGTLTLTTGLLNINGNNTSSGTFNAGTSTVNYNRTTAQTIRGTTYYNLTVSNAGTSTLGADAAVNNNLSVTGGTLDCSNFQITGNASGILSLAASTTLTLGNVASATAIAFPTLFTSGNISLNATSTVIYTTDGAQTVSVTPTYGNLTITTGATSSSKTLSGTPLNVAGNITLTNGTGTATLDITSNTVNLTGNLSGAGTLAFTSGAFNLTGTNSHSGTLTPGTGTFNYTAASGTQTVRATTYYNLTFSNGGTKQTAAGTTSVAGNLDVTGAAVADFTTNSSVINFNGSTPQTITSVTACNFYDITVSNSAGVTPTSAQNLINTLNLTGTGAFNANGNLTLISTTSRTGSIGILSTPTNFTGNIIMQRYVSGAQGYRYVGAAIDGATLSNLTPEIRFDGMIGGTNLANWCNAYTYNEASTGAFANGWTAVPNINISMTAGLGFAIYFYNNGTENLPATIDITGDINKGNQTLPVTFNNSGNADDGWNLVANPYPSAIDWDAATGWTRTNIQGNTYYAWNDAAQNYASYPAGGPGVNSGTRYIASSQGFMVKANAVGPALNMTENVKTSTNPTPSFWKINAGTTPSAFTLKVTSNANSYSDETLIRFMDNATANKDLDYDAIKINSTNPSSPNMATLTGDLVAVCVNTLPPLTANTSIPVTLKGVAATYTISLNQFNNFPSNACLVLEDLDNGNKTDLRTNSSYTFTMAATASPVTRFLIHVSAPIVTVSKSDIVCNGKNNGQIIVSAVAGNTSYILKNSSGLTIQQNNNISLNDTVKNLAAGKYSISSSNAGAYCQTINDTIIITEPTAINTSTTASVISCKGYADATVEVAVTGGIAGYVYNWSNGASTQTLTKVPAGKYVVSIIDGNGCLIKDSITVADGAIPVTAAFTASSDTVYLSETPSVDFTNTSTGADSLIWYFTNDISSIAQAPSITYSDSGSYVVKLIVYSNGGCVDSTEKIIKVLVEKNLVGINKLNSINEYSVIAQNNTIILSYNGVVNEPIIVRVVNSLGQVVYTTEKLFNKNLNNYVIETGSFNNGVYFITILSERKQVVNKIMVSNY